MSISLWLDNSNDSNFEKLESATGQQLATIFVREISCPRLLYGRTAVTVMDMMDVLFGKVIFTFRW